jgi:hypothetical protein
VIAVCLFLCLFGGSLCNEIVAFNIKGINIDLSDEDKEKKPAIKNKEKELTLSELEKELIELKVELKYHKKRIAELEQQLNSKTNCHSERTENVGTSLPQNIVHSYYIVTREGVFLGKSQNKGEARGNALKKCMDNTFPKSQCKDSYIKSDNDFRDNNDVYGQTEYSYYISNRRGTFIGKSKNPAEARAVALKKCMDNTFPKSQCNESSLKSD